MNDRDEQARLVQRDFDRMKVVKHAEMAAREPFVCDSPLDENDLQGKRPESVEFSATLASWCFVALALLVAAVVACLLAKGG